MFVSYQTQKRSGYALNYGDKLRVDFPLAAETTELAEIIVSDRGFTKEVERAGAVTAITSQQIKNLPNEGRCFTRLNPSLLQGGGNFNLGE